MSRIYVYEITKANGDAVDLKVGAFIVDTEAGNAAEWGEWRHWTLYDERTGNFVPGFTGLRQDRVCGACYRWEPKVVRAYGHDGAHGDVSDAPRLVPGRAPAGRVA